MRYAIIGMNVIRARRTVWGVQWDGGQGGENKLANVLRETFQVLWPQRITPKVLATCSVPSAAKVNHGTIRVHTTASTHLIHFGAPSSCRSTSSTNKIQLYFLTRVLGITSKARQVELVCQNR